MLMTGRFWLMGCLCFALLAAQTLGQLHGLTHGAGHAPHTLLYAPQVTQVVLQKAAQHSPGQSAHHSLLDGFFAGHDDESAGCLVFDQLSHFDALLSLPMALPLALTTSQLATSAGLAVARWHAQFQARGPPFPH